MIGGFPIDAVAWTVDEDSAELSGLTSPGDFSASYDAATGVLTVTITNPPAWRGDGHGGCDAEPEQRRRREPDDPGDGNGRVKFLDLDACASDDPGGRGC